ncbi:unnamed protein product, partial [marine sediment metagenome]
KDARVEWILDSVKKYDDNNLNEVNPVVHAEIVNVCKQWKAFQILWKLYKQNKLRKPTVYHVPKQKGPKLPRGTRVMSRTKLRGTKVYPRKTLCRIIEIVEHNSAGVFRLSKETSPKVKAST